MFFPAGIYALKIFSNLSRFGLNAIILTDSENPEQNNNIKIRNIKYRFFKANLRDII